MKSNDKLATEYDVDFNGENTLITKENDGIKIVIPELSYLNSKDKTVIITDQYIFKDKGQDYKNDVLDALYALEAKKIIFSIKNYSNVRYSVKNAINSELKNKGILTEFKKRNIHNRYWICVETKKGLDFPSLNNIGKSVSSVLKMPEADVEYIISMVGV